MSNGSPQMPGNPYQGVYDPTGGIATMLMSIAGGSYAQSTGSIPFQFAPTQSSYDYLQSYHRMQDTWRMIGSVQDLEARNAQRLYQGAANIFGYGNSPEVAAWGNVMGQNYGQFAPFIAQLPGGRNFLSAAGGSHGSAMVAGMDVMGYKSVVDPVSGSFGYTPATAAGLVRNIEGRYYSGGNDTMRGVRMDDLTGFYGEMSRAGMMVPRSARDSGAADVRAEEIKRVSDSMGEMAEVIRALKDIVGPNGSKEQLAQALKDYTQNNAAGMGWKEIAQSLRLTEQLAKQSGIGVDQMRAVAGYLGQTASAEGISRASVMPATQALAAYRSGWNASGLGSIPGLDMERESVMHGQLTQRAGSSAVAGQLGATLRMGSEIGFTAGSEADQLYQAIQAGQTSYNGGKSVYVSEQEWLNIMQRSGVDSGLAHQMRRQSAPNQRAAFNMGGADVARRLQGQIDIQPRIGAGIASALGGSKLGSGVGSQKLAGAGSSLAGVLMNLPPEAIAKATRGDMSEVIPAITKALRDAGFNVTDKEAAQYASMIYGAAGNAAAQRGYESFERVYAAHSPGALREAERARTMGGLRADAASQLSGVGDDPLLDRVVGAVMSATPDTTPGDLMQQILNIAPSEELAAQLQGHMSEVQKAIEEGEAALKAPGMMDSETGKLTKAGVEARRSHLEKIRKLVKPVQADMDAIREARKASGESAKSAAAAEGTSDAGAPGQPTAQGTAGRDLVGGGLTLSGRITIPGLGEGVLTGSATRSGVGTV